MDPFAKLNLVGQNRYEVFYERVMDLVKYGKVCHSYIKSRPQNMTREEADLYAFNERCRERSQLTGYGINLRGKKYGDYIDRKYKERYMDIIFDYFRSSNSWDKLYEFEKEVANDLKKRIEYENSDHSIEGIYAAGTKQIIESGFSHDIISNALQEYEKISWLKSDTSKKKTLWDKIKDFFE